MTEVDRPEGLGDSEWTAINDAVERLARARSATDAPLIVGCAKDLCESVARVVINARGGTAPGHDMPDLITAAHKLLEFQPGEGLAVDGEARKMAQSLKTMMSALTEMRNRHGTGHGRAAPSGITSEHSELAHGTALLWCNWALRRLEPYVAGNVTALVNDLESATFHKGDLARRLNYANLPQLDEHALSRLGLAVGRRSSRGTFVVAENGVDAIRPEDASTWPAPYIKGVVLGLMFDANGYLDLGEWPAWAIRQTTRLVTSLRDGTSLLRDIADRVGRATESRRVISDEADRREAAGEARSAAESATDAEQSELLRLIAMDLENRD